MKTVRHTSCRCGVKRGFMSKRDADKALGRAQAKRNRAAESTGTRRGLRVEQRYYECDFGMWHLTSENRKSYESRMVAA
ncbi:hypothetical protein SEA_YOSIF_62 [Streptomyces phage Yosif]|uniref:Uncharacterized protein n=1 Tax=Streptomyces phage Yosif TaxID=2201421 RepID=A0A2Z4QCI3_9CAUD|nr:hypothetical protein KGG71_gp62 [Streptomyces phage Yosif]AWY07626.1 hypothetical protein SEA_YOSIF_62 [Streptomyces phage Yosif]